MIQNLLKSTDCLSCHLQEMLKEIIEILFHVIIYHASEEESYEKIIETNKKNDYTTGNLFNFSYLKENYRLIANDLSKQTNLKDPKQINFIGKIKRQDHGATTILIIEKLEEATSEFLQNSVNIL